MKNISIVFLIVICIIFSGCSTRRKIIDVSQENGIGIDEPQDINDVNGKDLYSNICELIENNNSEFKFENIHESDIINTYQKVIREHPEYFWLGEGYSLETHDDGTTLTVIFRPMYSNDLNDKKDHFNSIVNNIVNSIDSKMNAYDNILFIHDYIIDTTVYDKNTLLKIDKENSVDKIYNASTAYGCLVDKKAICSGYSAAFQLLAQKLGFECGRVTGAKKNGDNHEWNYIKIENEYYFIDVTWDDPVNDKNTSSKCYDFFCITEEELKETHIIGKNQSFPKCTGSKYNYYIYNDLYVKKYSFEAIKNICDNTLNNKIAVKFLNKSECEKAIVDLIKSKKIFRIIDSSNVNYSIGSSEKTLTIYY